MVAVMRRSSCGKAKLKVKFEVDDTVQGEQLFPPDKRPKLFSSSAEGLKCDDAGKGEVAPFEHHPLGLRLKKSPSFLELVRTTLSQQNNASTSSPKALSHKGAAAASPADKLKASNFHASLLKIGSWEYKSRYEGDLVAKCYFAKRKLVWEVLDGALKNKIEIRWSDVVAIKANYGVAGMDTLDVALARQPLFFRETNPQPRKHTLWQSTSDFTGGQANICRHHFLQCQEGLSGRHFEKLMQCDPRLNFLSQQQKFVLDSPHFESKDSLFGDHGVSFLGPELNSEQSSFLLFLPDEVASPSRSLCTNGNKMEDFPRTFSDNYLRKAASPSSVMDTRAIEDIEQSGLKRCTPINVPEVPSSMSISNMVVHISHCMSEEATPTPENPFLTSAEASKRDVTLERMRPKGKHRQLTASSQASADVKKNSGCDKGRGMQTNDSACEVLLNLPSIASLPRILPNAPEDPPQNQQSRWCDK